MEIIHRLDVKVIQGGDEVLWNEQDNSTTSSDWTFCRKYIFTLLSKSLFELLKICYFPISTLLQICEFWFGNLGS
jgi:hypothetical protein